MRMLGGDALGRVFVLTLGLLLGLLLGGCKQERVELGRPSTQYDVLVKAKSVDDSNLQLELDGKVVTKGSSVRFNEPLIFVQGKTRTLRLLDEQGRELRNMLLNDGVEPKNFSEVLLYDAMRAIVYSDPEVLPDPAEGKMMLAVEFQTPITGFSDPVDLVFIPMKDGKLGEELGRICNYVPNSGYSGPAELAALKTGEYLRMKVCKPGSTEWYDGRTHSSTIAVKPAEVAVGAGYKDKLLVSEQGRKGSVTFRITYMVSFFL